MTLANMSKTSGIVTGYEPKRSLASRFTMVKTTLILIRAVFLALVLLGNLDWLPTKVDIPLISSIILQTKTIDHYSTFVDKQLRTQISFTSFPFSLSRMTTNATANTGSASAGNQTGGSSVQAASTTGPSSTSTVNFGGVTINTRSVRNFTMGAFSDTITPAYRENLKGDELLKFHKEAVVPLTELYSLTWASLDPSKESTHDFYTHTNKIVTNQFRLRTALQSNCMGSVFKIFPIQSDGKLDTTKTDFLDLLEHPTDISERQVRLSNRIWSEGTSERLHAQNIAWTQELLLGSCDASLRHDIESRLTDIPDNEQGGPLIYHMIMNMLISSSHEANRAVIRKLESISVTDFPGENMQGFTASFNNVVSRLSLTSGVPNDLAAIFFDRLKTCTVGDFVQALKTLKVTKDPLVRNYPLLKDRANEWYQEMLLSHEWLPTTKSGGSFNTIKTGGTSGDKSGNSPNETRVPIDRNPPKPGEPNKRPKANGRGNQYWCGLCWNGVDNSGRWGNHSTDRHDATKIRHRGKTTQANLAGQTCLPTSTNTTPSSEKKVEFQDDNKSGSNTGNVSSNASTSSSLCITASATRHFI